MEAFQPFLIALLALNMAAFIALLMRTVREGRERRQEQAVIDAASPRVQSRLAAIRDPSIPPGPEPTYEPGITVVDVPRSIPTVAGATTSGRRVWRDASAAIALFVCIALVLVFAAPSLGLFANPPSPVIGVAPGADGIGLSGGATFAIPDPPSPSPSLPLTGLARPIASFSCTHLGPRRVAFHDTSQTWGAPATYHWDFGGDGSSSAADPKHRFSKPGGYDVSLVVSNSAGRSDAFTLHVHPDHGEGAIKHGRCPSGR
jgi:hypothetical protein